MLVGVLLNIDCLFKVRVNCICVAIWEGNKQCQELRADNLHCFYHTTIYDITSSPRVASDGFCDILFMTLLHVQHLLNEQRFGQAFLSVMSNQQANECLILTM